MKADVTPVQAVSRRVVGSGPDVILIHGWSMSGAVFDPLLAHLPADRLRFIIPDLPGTGRSRPADRYDIETFASTLWSLADELELTRPILVGHSMGGQIAQVMVADRPDDASALILMNPVPAAGLPLPADARALFAASAGDPDKQSTILDLACCELDDAGRAHLLAVAATASERFVVDSLAAWTAGGFAERLSRITARTEVIATSDPFLPPSFLQEAVVDLIAGATLHVFDGPGHYPLVERPAETAALLTRLIDR